MWPRKSLNYRHKNFDSLEQTANTSLTLNSLTFGCRSVHLKSDLMAFLTPISSVISIVSLSRIQIFQSSSSTFFLRFGRLSAYANPLTEHFGQSFSFHFDTFALCPHDLLSYFNHSSALVTNLFSSVFLYFDRLRYHSPTCCPPFAV
jgi:hypothetical protein